MIVKLEFPVWGRCLYDLAPKPSEFDEFRQQAGAWTLWRNAHRHAYQALWTW